MSRRHLINTSREIMKAFGEIWRSNLFQKWLMAITGLLLVLFLLGHLSGNLLVFLGPAHLNEYAHGLRTMGHGAVLWGARLGLLAFFILHVSSAITLSRRNRQARPQKYVKVEARSSTLASRTMLYSGLLLISYVLYHLAHFTWGAVHSQHYAQVSYILPSGEVVPDVYTMVVKSFSEPLIVILYLLSMVMVGLHLNHAISSAFQTMGVTNRRIMPLVRVGGPALSVIIALGFSAVPLAIILGFVKI
ncbi:MAG: succinate dehydrogenase cytochrome b subunit [Candidatus Kapabacteria bacterium]|nr:succinate dehydrogenase cytochrome b subunit [Candidatus Kapabacteria bacterium]